MSSEAHTHKMSEERLRELRHEAAGHSDWELVETCDQALLGDPDAWALCESIMVEAEAEG